MVKGNHVVAVALSLVYRTIGLDGIPTLPGGGGTGFHLIHPAAAALVHQKVKGKLFIAIVSKQGQNMLRSKETGLHPVPC